MIYIPYKFLFIHIPRTAGTAITDSVAAVSYNYESIVVVKSTMISGVWQRHARAINLQPYIPEWYSLYKFAVIRNPYDILESGYSFVHHHAKNGTAVCELEFCKEWATKSFEDYVRYNLLLIDGGFWRYWCCDDEGADLGVMPIIYDKLRDMWSDLCCVLGPVALRRTNGFGRDSSITWTDGLRRLVNEKCCDDFDMFGFCRIEL